MSTDSHSQKQAVSNAKSRPAWLTYIRDLPGCTDRFYRMAAILVEDFLDASYSRTHPIFYSDRALADSVGNECNPKSVQRFKKWLASIGAADVVAGNGRRHPSCITLNYDLVRKVDSGVHLHTPKGGHEGGHEGGHDDSASHGNHKQTPCTPSSPCSPSKQEREGGSPSLGDWRLTEANRQHAKERGLGDDVIARSSQRFGNYHVGKRRSILEWSGLWQNWIMNERGARTNQSGAAPAAAPAAPQHLQKGWKQINGRSERCTFYRKDADQAAFEVLWTAAWYFIKRGKARGLEDALEAKEHGGAWFCDDLITRTLAVAA